MLISDWITLLGIIVTGIFSCLVWWSTKKTADVAKASFELNVRLETNDKERIEKQRAIMRRLLIPQILKESQKVHDAIVDTDVRNIHRKLTNDAPHRLNINMTDLAEYFSEEEVRLITNAWKPYEDYISKYYRNGYNGNDMNILLEKAPTVIHGFHSLIEKLKRIKFD